MVDFVEQATLKVRDKSTGTLRKINTEIKKLSREAKKLDGMPIGFKNVRKTITDLDRIGAAIKRIPKNKTSTVNVRATGITATRNQIDNVSRNRTSSINARATNVAATSRQLANLARTRTATIQTRTVGGGGTNPTGTRTTPTGGNTVGAGVRDALNPRQIGRDMARGFTFSIQGELFQVTRAIVRTVANAPANLDDALARARISGRTDDEISFLRAVAEQGSKQFQAATEADIIVNSGEVLGRFGDLTDPIQQDAAEKSILRLARNIQILDQALPNGGTGGAGNQARLVETAIQQLGATNDPERAADISRSVLQAIIASGGDLQAGDVKRTLQQLPTGRSAVSDDTLLQALLIRDEGGRRSTGNFDQLLSDLVRGNLNAGDKGRQLRATTASGASVRNRDGSSDLFTALGRDFLGTVENEIAPLLTAAGIEISRENAGPIRAFLDNQLGLSKQGGITFLTDALVNSGEARNEFDRARRTTPEVAIQSPTVRQELRAVSAQFENVAASGLEPLLPAVKSGLDTISNVLNDLQAGESVSAAQLATASAAAIPIAFGAALQGFADPQTRPLATAGLALTGSAAQLSAAALALTGSAALAGVGGGRGGGRNLFRSAAAFGGGLLAAGRRALVANPITATAAAAVTPTALGVGSLTPGGEEFGQTLSDLPVNIAQALSDFETRAGDARAAGRDGIAADLIAKAAAIADRVRAGDTFDGASFPTLADGRQRDALSFANLDRIDANAIAEDAAMRAVIRSRPGEFAGGPLSPTALAIPPDEAARIAALQQQAFDVGAELPSNLSLTFGDAQAGFQTSLSALEEINAQFGPAAGEALLAFGPAIGQLIGENARAAIGRLDLNISQSGAATNADTPTPRLDTGQTTLG